MDDDELVGLCARCLADIATFCVADDDLTGGVTALLEEVHEACPGRERAVMDAAVCAAVALLDGSDMDAKSFVTGLRRLDRLSGRPTLMAACAG